MHWILVLSLFRTLIGQQIPQLCSKATEYSNCALNATLQVAACNQNVDSNPDSKYYTCLCDGYQATLRCYSLCPDDPQLQLQFRAQKESTSSTCKAAGDTKLKESSSLSFMQISISSKTSFTDSKSSSTTAVNFQDVKGGPSTTTSVLLGSGGSRAMSPESFTIGDFPFLKSWAKDHGMSYLIMVLVALRP